MASSSLALRVLTPDDYKRSTWKNGLGHTDEIAIHPDGADLRRGDFLWRLSSARIEQASPFSVFPNHDRILIVLKGEGVHLTHTFEPGADEEEVDVPPLSAYEFPGDIPSRCELLNGPITDLSIFVRKAEVEAMADTVTINEGEPYSWVPSGRWNFAFAAGGQFGVESPRCEPQRLMEGQTLRIDLSQALTEDQAIEFHALSGEGQLVLVSLQG